MRRLRDFKILKSHFDGTDKENKMKMDKEEKEFFKN